MCRFISFLISLGFALSFNQVNAHSGNIFPIRATHIELQKEKIQIRYVQGKGYLIEVFYEFFNPGKTTVIEFGFKEDIPHYDCESVYDTSKINIRNLQMQINNTSLQHKITLVDEEVLDKKSRIRPVQVKQKNNRPHGYLLYLYHTKAKFKTGINTLHTSYYFFRQLYDYTFFGWNFDFYSFRGWKNQYVKDFEIQFEPATFSRFEIYRNFFNDSKDWILNGSVFAKDSTYYKWYEESDAWKSEFPPASLTEFMVRQGSIQFRKQNFLLDKNLVVISKEECQMGIYDGSWDYRLNGLNFEQLLTNYNDSFFVKDSTSLSILQNFPYARRGYIFKDQLIQTYYEKLDWYIPDSAYFPNETDLTPEEKEWLKTLILIRE